MTAGEHVCCAGFRLNKSTDKCEECPIGFYHWNCAKKCSYPTYGRDCQKKCDCNESLCSFSFGCIKSEYQTQIQTKVTRLLKKKSERTLHYDVDLSTFQFHLITKGIDSKSETITGSRTSTANTKTSSQQKNVFPTHILFIISCSIAVFVVLFGVYVVITVYRNCFMKKEPINQVDQKAPNKDRRYFQVKRAIQEQRVELQQLGQSYSCDDSMYLSPSYLTPISDRHDYVEVTG
ncbi:uncharacterized protein LOC133203352 [Saccostrea echinata]|uniref:uncharacterized protein LOC133203352 n=1 Tax=Saccostrea echinata TaxID=191078 RepID=UPI002A7F2755|nr:uncharacterized protein LOC133203352 [Saccostrea echinata]